MVGRDDREHDIAAWFGVNQGRIAEVKAGSHGSQPTAPANQLPPKGPPGPKGSRLRVTVGEVIAALESQGQVGVTDALKSLKDAQARYDQNEA